MSSISSLIDRIEGGMVGASVGKESMARANEALTHTIERAQESIAQLELALDNQGWNQLTLTESQWNFKREYLKDLISMSRMMYLVNPLIKRAVTVQELYVWGSGCTIKAETPIVDDVVRSFFDSRKNKPVFGNESFSEREREQRIDGNTFLTFFVNPSNGAARVRLLPVDQVTEIITNPEDSKEVWFYKRVLPIDTSGQGQAVLYPDIDYNPTDMPVGYESVPIKWDRKILHIKTGGLSMMKFGVPELYSALNWATAYKKILENFSSILSAYARMAMKVSNSGDKKDRAATKSKLATSITNGSINEKNPPPNTASWAVLSGGIDISAIKTANSTTGPDEARALRSMVAAGTDTPEHFFGDSDIGNFATSTTLDRPTELKMVDRQKMWSQIICRVISKLIEWSTVAPNGKLRHAQFKVGSDRDLFDAEEEIVIEAPAGSSTKVEVTFPSILERDVTERVRSVVAAATLNGSTAEGIIPDRKFLFKLLMIALGEKNVDDLVETYYPESVPQGFKDPEDEVKDDRLAAQGKKELGDAALMQADAAKKNAAKPVPKVNPRASLNSQK